MSERTAAKPASWETIARTLGERMANHAYCDDHDRGPLDPENCPFCRDITAYREFAKKAGLGDGRTAVQGESIALHEVPWT